MKMRINCNLQCEVDTNKLECKREPAHCHVTRNGIRIAKVWLNPICIENGHSLTRDEADEVVHIISNHKTSFEKEYFYNRKYGSIY